jgi:integrase
MQRGTLQLVLTNGVSTGASTSVPTGQPSKGSGAGSARPVLLFAEYAVVWLESIRGLVGPRTLEAYGARLERYVLPLLGERRLDDIVLDDVLALISDMRARGYSGATIRATLTPVSRLFARALRQGLVAVNPVGQLDRSERPRVSRPERPVLNRAQIGSLLNAATPRYRTLLATAILSGARQGELLGLRWKDVDFAQGVIHVRRALNRQGQDAPPKTPNAIRDVILIPALAELLSQHHERSCFGEPDDFVFATSVGTPFHWANISRRALKPALKKAGIEPLRWHDLRHCFASLLIAGGANITFVSRQLGHSRSDITLSVYGHLIDREEQARRMREVLEVSLGDAVRGGSPTRFLQSDTEPPPMAPPQAPKGPS